jgi:catechol 2,3-dioxygenase-like lactoylglutathione lyase family enzyme
MRTSILAGLALTPGSLLLSSLLSPARIQSGNTRTLAVALLSPFALALHLSAFNLSFAASTQAAVDTIAYDNVHVAVTDPAAARQWYQQYLGGEERDGGVVYFGDTYVRFVPTDEVRPSTGSVIDHIGISFSDLTATMARLEGSGARILTPLRYADGYFNMAYIEDPWGVKFELVEDAEQLGFHHVHLRVTDPQQTLDWFEDKLGGAREKFKGQLDGLRYGGVWLLASPRGNEELAPSAQRSIRNLAWQVSDVIVASADFQSKGVTLISDSRPFQNLRYAFFEDPEGVRVEVLHYVDP